MSLSILMPIMIFMTKYYHNSNLSGRFRSVNHSFSNILRLAIYLIGVFLLSSCEEGPTKIGEGILPGSDFVSINSTDTLSVWSYTMYNSTVPTNDPSLSFIGHINDPYFGTTTGELVTQLRLSSPWKFGPVTIDSVKLFLRLLDVKGGSGMGGHYLRLSEITDQIYTDSIYYSNTQTDTTDFAVTLEMPPLKQDTISNITIPMPVSFGEYLVRDTSQFFYSTTKSDFRSYFKGLYLRMSATIDPILVTINLLNSVSSGADYNNYIALYMHDTANIFRKYYFIIDAVHKNACYNKFSHDFSTADADKKIEHINDDNFRDSLSYLQYLNGVYTRIVFPGLESIKNDPSLGNFAINKARLIVPVYLDGDRYTETSVPGSLRLRFESESGVKYDVPDYYVDDTHSFFDGSLNKFTGLYSFNLAAYVQAYLEDKTGEFKPELEIFQSSTGLKNVILKANDNKTPIRFEMTYTKF